MQQLDAVLRAVPLSYGGLLVGNVINACRFIPTVLQGYRFNSHWEPLFIYSLHPSYRSTLHTHPKSVMFGTMHLCGTLTALGSPVVPEVCMT